MQNFSEYVNCLKRKIKSPKDETIFICIGSKEIIWDSIGPQVGTYLKNVIGEKNVIGDLKNNICCDKDLRYYYPKVKGKFIVAIDSAISKEELQGEIFVTKNPIIMGLGINQNKGSIGNIGIKVGVNTKMLDRKCVIDISRKIVKGIEYWYKISRLN